MGKNLIFTLAVAAMLAAGCADDGMDDEGPGAPGDGDGMAGAGLPARSLPWTLTECRFGVALVGVPAADVAPHLPPGFRSLSLQEVGLGNAPNPRDDGNFGMELFSCAEGSGLEGNLSSIAYGSFFTAVEPPEEHRRNVTTHFVKWDVLVPDEARRELLRSYGIPARNGTVAFTAAEDEGTVAFYDGVLSFNGTEVHALRGTAAAPYDDGSFVEYTMTPGGLAEWTANYTWLGGGVGPQTVQAAPGSLAAEILGTAPRQGVGFAGRVSFVDGAIGLPAQPASP